MSVYVLFYSDTRMRIEIGVKSRRIHLRLHIPKPLYIEEGRRLKRQMDHHADLRPQLVPLYPAIRRNVITVKYNYVHFKL